MAKPLTFQQVIMKLHQFWADQGCVIWEPYNVQVGAGTSNPATLLRVLGPEPWRVAYVEPSVRPDDGRFGENPNRMQKYYQYQVILKPDPGDPQGLYLKSLEALGINPREHDIRFVEDNWEQPAMGAWGLGWEVWLDGQEITQFTYFQQAGGIELEIPAVEITYGVERIVLALQDKESAWDIEWMEGGLQYRDLFLQDEIDHCEYYFNIADIDGLTEVFNIYEAEHQRALDGGASISAYDYVLKCSHLFNILDTRGAIGVTERATYFRRMRDMMRNVAKIYVAQREEKNYPLMKLQDRWQAPPQPGLSEQVTQQQPPTEPADVLLEIGVEELPAAEVNFLHGQLSKVAQNLFDDLRLDYEAVNVYATPRRLVLHGKNVAPRQPDVEAEEKGPPAARAFDEEGNPTKAAQGFARSRGVDVSDLEVKEIDGGEYVVAMVRTEGRYTIEVLEETFPEIIAGLKFSKTMRWNTTGVAFSRPVRWYVALFGNAIIPFEYAGVFSSNVTHGLRPYGSLPQVVKEPLDYFDAVGKQNIHLEYGERRDAIIQQITALAAEIGGTIPDDPGLLDEVVNLVEAPTAFRGQFNEDYLQLPRDVLVTVMRKHQRYFPVEDANGQLMPYFIAVRNGDDQHVDKVIAGNEAVLRARFSDANFFYREDRKKTLKDFLPRLATLTFEEHLGSMLDKNNRVAMLVPKVGDLLGMTATDIAVAERAAHIAKADLATQMVVEMTSLQGAMGREYAKLEDQPDDVADAIYEHWQPRNADDTSPASTPGVLLAITDRLDSLVGLFAAGHAPRSTADPYGLRRAALGIIQILIDKGIDVDLTKALELAALEQPIEASGAVRQQVLDFIAGRLRVYLGEQGFAADVISAVLSEQAANPYSALVGIRELSEWVARDDWETVLDSFARCVRITRAEDTQHSIDEALFEHDEEKNLFAAYEVAAVKLGADVEGSAGGVAAFLSAFEPMVPAVTAFFDNVLVNAEDPAVRANRLGLLQAISAMQTRRADLSELDNF